MAPASENKKKGSAKPPASGSPAIGVRLPADVAKKLTAWIAAQPDLKPSRPQAVLALLGMALDAAAQGKPRAARKDPAARAAGAAFAARAAGEQIDRSLKDAGEPDEVRADRKQRLMKMPGELKKPPR